MNWEIELYSKENKFCPVLEFILELTPKQQAKIQREIDLLEEFGTNLLYPHTKKLEGKEFKDLWELRIKLSTDSFRIFYFISVGKKIVLLHAIKKKTDKTPIKELEISINYMKDYLRRVNKK